MKKLVILLLLLAFCSPSFAVPTFGFGESANYRINGIPLELGKFAIWGQNLEAGTLDLVLGCDASWFQNQTAASPFSLTQPAITNPPSGDYFFERYRITIPSNSSSSVLLNVTLTPRIGSFFWPPSPPYYQTQVFMSDTSKFTPTNNSSYYFGVATPEPFRQYNHEYTLDMILGPEPATFSLLILGLLTLFRQRVT